MRSAVPRPLLLLLARRSPLSPASRPPIAPPSTASTIPSHAVRPTPLPLRTTRPRPRAGAPTARIRCDALRAGLAALASASSAPTPIQGRAIELLRRLTRRSRAGPTPGTRSALAETRRAAWEQTDPAGARQPGRDRRPSSGRSEHEYRRARGRPGVRRRPPSRSRDLALDLRDTALYAGARDALRQAEHGAGHARRGVLLAWGRLERAADEPDAAVAAFASGRAGGRRARARRPARARADQARHRRGRRRGRRTSRAPRRRLRRRRRLSRRSRADRGRLGPGRVRRRARRRPRGAGSAASGPTATRTELRADGERLREHYRRLLYARRHFALTDRAADSTARGTPTARAARSSTTAA